MNWQLFYNAVKNNLGLKIIALLVAVLFWIYVTIIQMTPPGRPADETPFSWRE